MFQPVSPRAFFAHIQLHSVAPGEAPPSPLKGSRRRRQSRSALGVSARGWGAGLSGRGCGRPHPDGAAAPSPDPRNWPRRLDRGGRSLADVCARPLRPRPSPRRAAADDRRRGQPVRSGRLRCRSSAAKVFDVLAPPGPGSACGSHQRLQHGKRKEILTEAAPPRTSRRAGSPKVAFARGPGRVRRRPASCPRACRAGKNVASRPPQQLAKQPWPAPPEQATASPISCPMNKRAGPLRGDDSCLCRPWWAAARSSCRPLGCREPNSSLSGSASRGSRPAQCQPRNDRPGSGGCAWLFVRGSNPGRSGSCPWPELRPVFRARPPRRREEPGVHPIPPSARKRSRAPAPL